MIIKLFLRFTNTLSMKKFFFVLFGLSTVLLYSCKSGSVNEPKAVLSQFFEALSKNDIAKARTLATAESKSMIDLMETGMKMDKDSKDVSKFNKSNWEFGNAKIEGDKAVIAAKELTSGETLNYSLKKENGAWKVAFDKASMMSVGMEKMKEKGINPMDSINKAMQELKNINRDSLDDDMKEGMKMLDSLHKQSQKTNQ